MAAIKVELNSLEDEIRLEYKGKISNAYNARDAARKETRLLKGLNTDMLCEMNYLRERTEKLYSEIARLKGIDVQAVKDEWCGKWNAGSAKGRKK